MNQGSASQRLRPFRPQRFGRYTLLMPISTGGMGEIFLARLEGAHGFDKLCVIKKILPHLAEDQEFVERFVDEARILVKLSHGNIAQVLDMGVSEGAPYIALEFVDGKDLRRVLSRMRDRQLPIPLSFILYSMTRVLDALAYAHRKRGDDDRELNLVHRDVSPQNVLISYEGEVKVIDFGLAKSTLSSSRTNPSIIMGKFMYMSPEQARHQRADRRSDLYAVGLCLYELVTGHNPFDEVPPGELMAQVASPSIRPLLELDPLCPVALSDAVARALNPEPASRFQTAEEFRAKLLAILLEIDPSAGPETAAGFMREAFAVEYHAERKMLGAVREQADSLDGEDDEAPAPADETSQVLASDLATRLSAPEGGPRPLPVKAAAEPLELAKLPEAFTPQPKPDAPKAESLSFQPTRKGSIGSFEKKRPDADRETMPAIAGLPPEEPRKRSPDQMPTEMAIPVVSMPEDLPSIVLDGIEGNSVEPPAPTPTPPAPPRKSAAPAEKGAEAPRKKPVKTVATSERKKVERPAPAAATAAPAPRPRANVGPAPAPQAASAPRETTKTTRRTSLWVWLVLPLLAVLAVGAYIAWDVFSEKLKAKQLEEESRAQGQRNVDPEPERKSREVKVNQPADDDLATLPAQDGGRADAKKPKDPPVRKAPVAPVALKPQGSPGEQAVKALKADFDKVVEEAVAKKYRLKVNKLESELATKGSDPAWVADVKKLDDELKAVLASQQ